MTRANRARPHDREWREPAEVVAEEMGLVPVDTRVLRSSVRGAFWEVLERARLTLLVTREYEHLVMGLAVVDGRPRVSYLPLPHPSGIVADRARGVVTIASTRNPNRIVELAPITRVLPREDVRVPSPDLRPLVPTRTRYLPGSLYLHDLALVGGRLHGNAVAHNAVVAIGERGFRYTWWPACVDDGDGPDASRNYLQLNSIAPGANLRHSFYSASADHISARRPGQRNFPVDGRGVVFSGATREPMLRGLTRPHSARLHRGRVWVDNSGYGELVVERDGAYEVVARLPGWTRGLAFAGDVAFVGTSRILPRFSQYAPGIVPARARCGVHAVDARSGRVLGSLLWPEGDQIFGIDWLPARTSAGFPHTVGRRDARAVSALYYAFAPTGEGTR